MPAQHRPASQLVHSRYTIAVLLICALAVTFMLLAHPPIKTVAKIKAAFKSSFNVDVPYQTGRPFSLGPNESYALRYPQPHSLYQQQLLPNVQYITHFGYNGHANQFVSISNAAYFALKTSRVYIIPTLFGVHHNGKPVPVSTFFDLDRFVHDSRIAAVEWSRVKPSGSYKAEEEEILPCWSLMEVSAGYGSEDFGSISSHGVKPVLWALPPYVRSSKWTWIRLEDVILWDRNDVNWSEWLEKVKQQYLPQKSIEKPKKGKSKGIKITENIKDHFNISMPIPTKQMICFDNTFYAEAAYTHPSIQNLEAPYESWFEGETDAWKFAGAHFRFNDMVNNEVNAILKALLGSSEQPFIAIHVRRGDFVDVGLLVPVQSYVDKLSEIQNTLQYRIDHPTRWNGPGFSNFRDHGIPAVKYPIVVATDEDPTSKDYKKMTDVYGWHILDKSALAFSNKTLEQWGGAILTEAIVSRASGFVGTTESTYSSLSGLRVKYWNGGPVTMARKPQS